MRIENHQLTNARVDGRQGTPPLHAPTSGVSSLAGTDHDLSSHTPAPELVQFVTQVHALDDVREDRVREVALRLASGAYFTRVAAERTAEMMLDA